MAQRSGQEMVFLFLGALILALQGEQKFLLFFHSFSTLERSLLVLNYPESTDAAVH